MEEKVNAIVIKTVPYMDYDAIVTLFTADGVLTAKMKGIKRATAKLKFAGEPFCFAEYILHEKQGKRTVTGASLIDGFYGIRKDYERFLCASVVLEFVQKTCYENSDCAELFLYTVSALKEICSGNKCYYAMIAFLLNAIDAFGYSLNFDCCSGCGCDLDGRIFLSCDNGGFICENCQNENTGEVSVQTFKFLKDVAGGIDEGEVERKFLIKAIKLLDFYISNKFGETFNSLKTLLKL